MNAAPSSNDNVTTCGHCGAAFSPVGRQTWCSPACRVGAWRRRHPTPTDGAPLPAKAPRRPVTVYECDSCGDRALGDQYCAGCRTFMHRVGIGGACPSCDTPLAVTELTATHA